MARIKKDKDSWKAGGVLHRNNRHDKSVSDSHTKPQKRKKNTKKYCKGIEGRPHVPIWRQHQNWANFDNMLTRPSTMEVACENCGKMFEVDYGYLGRPKKGREALLAKWTEKLKIE